MKAILLTWQLVLWMTALPTAEQLRGTIRDAETGDPVTNATVTLIELNRTAKTDHEGNFLFSNVPKGRHTVGIHAPVFSARHFVVQVPLEKPLNVTLKYDVHFDQEITVTAAPWAIKPLDTPQTVTIISNKSLSLSVTSLGEGLNRIPGVDQVGTGDALGTPVIRGVSENRIKITKDGIGQNHQQFSFRHSPNLELAFADKIEVIKGPHSVLHGPDAMGGVINVISAPLPTAFEGPASFEGTMATSYESNANRKTAQVGFQGGIQGFGWRIGLLQRDSGDMETSEGSLDNTDFKQTNADLNLGYSGGWGSLKFKASHWEDQTGFFRPVGFRLELEDDYYSLEGWHTLGESQLKWMAGMQSNRRMAYPVELNGLPSVDLELDSQTGKLNWRFPERQWEGKRFNSTLALEFTRLENKAHALKKLVPAYESETLAVIAFQEMVFGVEPGKKTVVSAGFRFDSQDMMVLPDPARQISDGIEETYQTATGTIGMVKQFSKTCSAAANVSRGWRPPSVFELFANGVHGGVSAIQLGNAGLEEETNLNFETSLRILSDHFTGSLTVYHTAYDQYISLYDTGDVQDNLPVFEYGQVDATMKGFEVECQWYPIEVLKLGMSYNALQSENRETGMRLPQTPANKGTLSADWVYPQWRNLKDPHLGLFAVLVGRGYVSGPDEPFGTATEPYQLLQCSAGFSMVLNTEAKRVQRISVDFLADNVLDETYKDFLYPYKPWANNPGRNLVVKIKYSF